MMTDLLPEKEFAMSIPCEQEKNITDIKAMLHGLTSEFRGLLGEMREVFVEDREHKIKIQALEKAQDVLFDKVRKMDEERSIYMKEKIEPMVEWKNKVEGSISAFRTIPIACVIITTILAIVSFSFFLHDKADEKISKKNGAGYLSGYDKSAHGDE